MATALLLHDSLRISTTLSDLTSPRHNAVHIQRQAPPLQHANLLLRSAHTAMAVPVAKPASAAEALVVDVADSVLQQAIFRDVCFIAQHLGEALHLDRVTAKLELVFGQNCPKFHAEHVGMRCLCTYAGPGTQFVANRHVRRKWDPWHSVVSVEEAHMQQAEPWDLLFLKGHKYPGMNGLGAVHRSPPGASVQAPRLVLTLDDTEPRSCLCDNHN